MRHLLFFARIFQRSEVFISLSANWSEAFLFEKLSEAGSRRDAGAISAEIDADSQMKMPSVYLILFAPHAFASQCQEDPS